MQLRQTVSRTTVMTVLTALVSLLAGIWLAPYLDTGAASQETALEHAMKHTQPGYVCPMHAEIVSAEEGTCPICGMDLVAVKTTQPEDDAGTGYPEVRVASTMINNLGVRVAQVRRDTLVRRIETPGFIQQMRKEKYSRYTAPAKGVVSKLYFSPGQWLQAGDPLVDIRLDDLVLVQEKHLELLARQAGGTGAEQVAANTGDEANTTDGEADKAGITLETTRKLMLAAGMTPQQIEALEASGKTSPLITLYAGHPGEIKELRVKAGDSVPARGMLFALGGLMNATVLANAFQRDASWIKPGQEVDVILPHEPGKVWKGRVSSGAVSINTNSQNIGIKFNFIAPDSIIKNGMYVVGHIYGQVRRDTLVLPREAVIYNGSERRVIVALGDGRFRPVPVTVGISNEREVEIVDGLEEGDTVVVSAQFLIDSESSLQASYRRIAPVE